jgi:hypothetical protein
MFALFFARPSHDALYTPFLTGAKKRKKRDGLLLPVLGSPGGERARMLFWHGMILTYEYMKLVGKTQCNNCLYSPEFPTRLWRRLRRHKACKNAAHSKWLGSLALSAFREMNRLGASEKSAQNAAEDQSERIGWSKTNFSNRTFFSKKNFESCYTPCFPI